MRNRAWIATILLITTADLVAAQSAEKQVLAAVQQFFDTMASRDVPGAEKVLLREGRFFNLRSEGDSEVVRGFTNAEFLDGLASREEDVLERMWEPEVRVHGGIAAVWTRYDFYRDGAFSHCGVDGFDLIRTPEGWKITGGIYTVERTGCPESPLGPPK